MSDSTEEESIPCSGSEWAVLLVGAGSTSAGAIRERARSAGQSIFEVDVGAVKTQDELVRLFALEFLVPHEIRGLDAVLSVLSDLGWLANDLGYLLVLEGGADLVACNRDLFEKLVQVLLLLCDRWRDRETPFHVLVETDRATVDLVKTVGREMYEKSRASKWITDSIEVPICDVDRAGAQ